MQYLFILITLKITDDAAAKIYFSSKSLCAKVWRIHFTARCFVCSNPCMKAIKSVTYIYTDRYTHQYSERHYIIIVPAACIHACLPPRHNY